MNVGLAARAAATGFGALLLIAGAFTAVLLVDYWLAAEYIFGGGPPYDQVLALTLPPAAVGTASLLLVRAIYGGCWRATISAMVGFVLIVGVMLEVLQVDTFSPGEDERQLAFALLNISVLSTFIATVLRNDVGRVRTGAILALSVVFVCAGALVVVAVPESIVGASAAMGIFAWVIVPAVVALLIPHQHNNSPSLPNSR